MPDGVFANPAFIDRFIRALVAGIRRQSDSLRGVIDAAVDGIHAEGQQVTGFKLRGEPATAEFLAERHGVVGELSVMLPPIVTGDVRAVRIDIRVQIIADAVGLQMRFFENHESANFEGNFAIRNPGGVETMCATAHVNDVAMGSRSMPAAHRAQPDIVEVPDGSTKEAGIKLMHLGTKDDAVDGGLVLPSGRVKLWVHAFFQDAVDERLTFFKNPILCECLDESLAGFENGFTREESFDVKVAIFIHALLKGGRVVANGGGILQPAERMLICLELMTERFQGAVGDRC